MPDIIKQVPSGNAGQKARGVGRDFVNTTYGVGLLAVAYATIRWLERRGKQELAKRQTPTATAPASASNDPFPGAA